MPKAFPFWVTGTAIILLFCGKIVYPAPAAAQQSQGAALSARGNWVQNGTHFLVRLDQEMNSGSDKVNQKIEVKTIEPLQTSSGHVLPAGATIYGHISRIEPGGLLGGARLWLTFDDIETGRGALPIVAEVSSVPGEFSVRQGESKEGEIEVYTQQKNAGARGYSRAGAAKGSAAGVAAHNGKAAAMGAATGGVASFLASSRIGQEIDLPKGTKLELVLDRPLYLTP